MNPAHIHLIVNHLPVVSVLFAIGFLTLGLVRKRDGLLVSGLVICIVVGLTAIPAFLSGEGAEEIVEDLPGVSHDLIHEHEETAELAFYFALGLGIIAAGVLIGGARKASRKKPGALLVLFVALITTVLMAQAANSGGEIRHPEIRDTFSPSIEESPGDDSEDHSS